MVGLASKGRVFREAIAHLYGNFFHIRLKKHHTATGQGTRQIIYQFWLHQTTFLVFTLKPGIGELNRGIL
jgi:hypothetical protein